MSEEIKQEGEFKIKTPSKPKNLGDNTSEPIKVNVKEPLIDIEPDIKKVVIKKLPCYLNHNIPSKLVYIRVLS